MRLPGQHRYTLTRPYVDTGCIQRISEDSGGTACPCHIRPGDYNRRACRQRFDFNRLSVPDLADHVSRVAAAQSISIDPDAARLIARRADGSARDA